MQKGSKPGPMRPMPGWEFNGPVVCCVRVYVIRATGLTSRKKDGSMSTFIQVRVGGKKADSRKRSRQEPGAPEYGEIFEFKAVAIPQDKDVIIAVKDRRLIGPDVELGQTKLDLENRLLTKWRATVGLPAQFHTGGVNAWRDQWSPLRILLHYARLHQLPPLTLSRSDAAGYVIKLAFPPSGPAGAKEKEFIFRETELDDVLPKGWRSWTEGALGSAKQQLALFVLRRLALVPEHVESRPLANVLDPSKRAGVLHCWVDVFPLLYGPVPPPVDIAVRRPIPMQLRLVVWNLRDVVCSKEAMGKTIGDLCVKAFINGLDNGKGKKTDVHYKSTDGSG